MFSFITRQSTQGHTRLPQEDAVDLEEKGSTDDDYSEENDNHLPRQAPWSRIYSFIVSQPKRLLAFVAITTALISLAFFFVTRLVHAKSENRDGQSAHQYPPCTTPSVRIEWRYMVSEERNEYIKAVQCLLEKQAKARPAGRLYDDFSFVYGMLGRYSLQASSFLPWHRLFLRVYEMELRTSCDYAGRMPYWDWTLDWQSFAQSPVFSDDTGFGGNGTLGRLPCVKNGPFSGLEVPYVSLGDNPGAIGAGWHCLRRNLTTAPVSSGGLSPDAVVHGLVETASSFEVLRKELENGPHAAISSVIAGDFERLNGPSDPLWFLHIGQLDRLWWMWQSRQDNDRGLTDYSGQARFGWPDNATLTDQLTMGYGVHFAQDDLRVVDVMNTEGDALCYTYAAS